MGHTFVWPLSPLPLEAFALDSTLPQVAEDLEQERPSRVRWSEFREVRGDVVQVQGEDSGERAAGRQAHDVGPKFIVCFLMVMVPASASRRWILPLAHPSWWI